MIELWEMSDGRIWQVTHDFGQVRVSSLLSDNALSMIGVFDNEHDVVRFAADYLELSVTFKVRG